MTSNETTNKIEQVLNSLDDLQKARVGPEFEEELMQKIKFLPRSRFMQTIAYATAAMAILTLGNILTLITSVEADEVESSAEASIGVLYESINYDEFE